VSVVILLADGVRPDSLDEAMSSGALPALARMRDEGGAFPITSCFPSVTGPAYAPFLMGRFPGPIGLPGLRWFDRAREATSFPDYCRSYIGYQMNAVDRDISPDAPTIWELVDDSVAALNVIGRGLAKHKNMGGITPRTALRAAHTHFTGNVAGWLGIDREVSDRVVARVKRDKPHFAFAALTGVDKVSHARGHRSPMLLDALRIVDDTVARLRHDAERDGRWRDLAIWIVSDHGHSPVSQHDDLVKTVQRQGYRTLSHPWVFSRAPEVGVMVSGNAMAHLYLDVASRAYCTTGIPPRYEPLRDMLLRQPSVDLMIVRQGADVVVTSPSRGTAIVRRHRTGNGDRYDYDRQSGDPLGIAGDLRGVCDGTAYAATIDTDYPDSVVQLTHLAAAPRSGEIILSAARGWDFRARYEPIPHVSSHGALHREHMMVPLLMNRPPRVPPRRTVDVMPSVLAALGRAIPEGLDGRPFM
jgi:hypothetical protein